MAIESLEDLKTALKDHANAEELVEYVIRSVEAEKNKGHDLKKAADKQAMDRRFELTKMREALTKVGYEESADMDEFLEDLAEKLGSANDGTKPSSDSELAKQMKTLRRDFEKTKKELADEKNQSSELKSKSARRVIKSKLADVLRDKVYGHDLLADALINDGKVSLEDDESVVFINGEDRIGFEDGIKAVLESRPDILKNQQTPGARTTASTKQNSKVKYTRSQLESMPVEEMRADMEAVNESWTAIRASELASG